MNIAASVTLQLPIPKIFHNQAATSSHAFVDQEPGDMVGAGRAERVGRAIGGRDPIEVRRKAQKENN